MIFTASVPNYIRLCIYSLFQHVTIFLSLIMQQVMCKHNYREYFSPPPKKEKPKLQKCGFIRKLYHTMNVHLYLGMAAFSLDK